ncbi:hypothetical protein X797_000848 [Metarhizium robertsii]|uniref:Uncharacterized protein n=2 Tax=Metarhizium robertsii TaxID=568076 RepID=E9ER11_METRA|nr:uncharacterized protein MAA_02460 [Metarhizium robertsii ARSEF 23]EFZ02878.1 hypothetical protein MAA_02460 [Metarhizium robertsii ARSEF 23]EXV06131.1 hypothetical protein X797_000848 [Metarhizium robertsii]
MDFCDAVPGTKSKGLPPPPGGCVRRGGRSSLDEDVAVLVVVTCTPVLSTGILDVVAIDPMVGVGVDTSPSSSFVEDVVEDAVEVVVGVIVDVIVGLGVGVADVVDDGFGLVVGLGEVGDGVSNGILEKVPGRGKLIEELARTAVDEHILPSPKSSMEQPRSGVLYAKAHSKGNDMVDIDSKFSSVKSEPDASMANSSTMQKEFASLNRLLAITGNCTGVRPYRLMLFG